jgi:hypothetical protein
LSITLQHTQENLCRAHIQAIAAVAGVNLGLSHTQDYGVDGQFDPVVIRDGRRITTGFPLPFQAKATINWDLKDGNIVYDLEAKTFNDMAMRTDAESTLVLILLCLPPQQLDWFSVSKQSTSINHCCYWHIIREELTENGVTKRIRIPEDQLLTPQALAELLDFERARRIGWS